MPVHFCARLHDAPLTCDCPSCTVPPDVDPIVVPNFAIHLLGHSYFPQAEALPLRANISATASTSSATVPLHPGGSAFPPKKTKALPWVSFSGE